MLTDPIIDFIFFFLDFIPDFNIPVLVIPQGFVDIINFAWYILPMDVISIFFRLSVYITFSRILLAIIYRIKSFIPTMGN